MPIPSKADCQAIADQKTSKAVDRIEALLLNNAANEIVGATIPYGGAGAGAVTALVTALQNKGWTVVRDDTNRILIVS
jgi:hypothetical protein